MGVGTAGTLWVQTAEVGRNVQQQGTFSKLGRYYVLRSPNIVPLLQAGQSMPQEN